MIERQDLIVFTIAARHLNFAAAAKELKITAPQVSKVVAKLEEQVRKTLFVRNTRQMKLSEHGAALLPVAEKALLAFEDAESLFIEDESDREVSGTLRINTAHTLGIKIIAKIVGSFQQKYPKIVVNVLLSDHYEDLIEQNLDMAIRIFKPEDSSLMGRKLGENPLVVCATPDYLRRHPPIKGPEDLAAHRVLYIPTHAGARFTKAQKTLGELCPIAWASATNGDFLTELAKHGAALVVRSKWSVQRELAEGSLLAIELNDLLQASTGVYAIFHPHKFMTKRLRLWLDHLVQEYPKDL